MKTLKIFSLMFILLATCLPMVSCTEDEPVVIEGYWTDGDYVWLFDAGICAVSDGDWTASGKYGNGTITVSDEEYVYNLKYSMPDNNTLVIKWADDGEVFGSYWRYNVSEK